LDLRQLLRAGRVFASGLEQKLGVDLNDSEQVVELVSDKAGRFVRLFEIASSRGEIYFRRLTCLLC